jgi:cell wall-associated NlpC family hydrolase
MSLNSMKFLQDRASLCTSLCLSMWLALGASAAAAQSVAPSADVSPRREDLSQLIEEKGWVQRMGEATSEAIRSTAESAGDVVLHALGFIGVPYRMGGSSVESGLDCSAFVRLVYKQITGLALPRSAAEQAAATRSIERSELQPGDLVFFNTLRRSFSHVGIYIGEGRFVHSPRTGGQVRVESMNIPYWQTRFNGARRVVFETTSGPR